MDEKGDALSISQLSKWIPWTLAYKLLKFIKENKSKSCLCIFISLSSNKESEFDWMDMFKIYVNTVLTIKQSPHCFSLQQYKLHKDERLHK